jgi:sodium transport system permease protein
VSLVLGKWGAVAAVGMLIAVLSCLSFLPGNGCCAASRWRRCSSFGCRARRCLFLALLLPLAGALAGLLMAMAIRCKTFKEAQANATVVVLGVSLLPMVTAVQPGRRVSPGTCGCRRWRRSR